MGWIGGDTNEQVMAMFDSFFFRAGDGIRDGHVTGVQTCALPIYERFQHAEGQIERSVDNTATGRIPACAGYRVALAVELGSALRPRQPPDHRHGRSQM